MYTFKRITSSAQETEELAYIIGKHIKGGELIELVSDLGGGKTTFVRGFVKGTGSSDPVASPSFTISRVYKAKLLEIHHLDLYRLDNPGLLTYELHDLFHDPKAVIIIEWANIIQDILPKNRITIKIRNTGDEKRELSFSCPAHYAYLIEEIC